ncbi:hypothetical protein CJ179_47160 [Rhodococcus sp. ACS1]|nr:hypothetical protein CJ179_47160 [Rhodococcus sp. ACS1]
MGAGSAGCVLADRLSKDPKNKVLLLDAGGSDRSLLVLIPKGFFFTMQSGRVAKHFETRPFGPTGAVDSWARVRKIGGSSSINGMSYNRGWAPGYDAIEEAGNRAGTGRHFRTRSRPSRIISSVPRSSAAWWSAGRFGRQKERTGLRCDDGLGWADRVGGVWTPTRATTSGWVTYPLHHQERPACQCCSRLSEAGAES